MTIVSQIESCCSDSHFIMVTFQEIAWKWDKWINEKYLAPDLYRSLNLIVEVWEVQLVCRLHPKHKATWGYFDQWVVSEEIISCTSEAQIRTWTYLQLLLVQLHLLQLVPDGLRVPGPVVSLQVVKLQVTKALLQLLEGVTKLKYESSENQSPVQQLI